MTMPNQNDPAQGGQNQNDPTGGHPAWDEVLAFIPDEHKAVAQEKFKSWDTGVQNRFQQLHSQYEPYQDILKEYSAEDLDAVVQMAMALQNDPRGFYDNLGNVYGYRTEQGSGNGNQPGNQQTPGQQPLNTGGGEQQTDPYAERFSKLEEALTLLIQNQTQFQTQTQEERENAQFEQVMSQLKQQYGDFDDDFVTTKIAAGMDPIKAVEAYQKLAGITQQQTNGASVPPILGSGGGLPTQQQDFSKMGSKDTRDLVAQLLQQAQAQNQ